jgi:hypothetical protein
MKEPPAQAQVDSAQRMRNELKELLNRSAGAREVLPHLANLEHALKTQGLAAFETIPPRILQRAANQLQSVMPQTAGPGIVELRKRLARILGTPASAAAPAPIAGPHGIQLDDRLQVSEASVSDFMRAVEATKSKD